VLKGESANTGTCLTQPGLEPMRHHTRVEHANNYTTDAVCIINISVVLIKPTAQLMLNINIVILLIHVYTKCIYVLGTLRTGLPFWYLCLLFVSLCDMEVTRSEDVKTIDKT
jgi:hypothetical protein